MVNCCDGQNIDTFKKNLEEIHETSVVIYTSVYNWCVQYIIRDLHALIFIYTRTHTYDISILFENCLFKAP